MKRHFLSRADVARLMEVSPNTVTRWAREGRLPFVLTLGGRRRYVRDDVEKLVKVLLDPRRTSEFQIISGRMVPTASL
ncbi:MAG: helix-turn-helix domain-containing protein [Dehalococcoidia bacterium]|nr:helix-turn-helix domain-containing protein [Dehalococcoidia bacterium]